jgi:hypothetical protein
MLAPVWKRNDKKASTLIIVFSIIVFSAIALLSRIQLKQTSVLMCIFLPKLMP